MKVAVPKEIVAGERRVAATPDSVKKIVKAGMTVIVEAGAGSGAGITDNDFTQAGAQIEPRVETLLAQADIILKVQSPAMPATGGRHELDLMNEGASLIALLQPMTHLDLVKKMAERRITAFSLDCLPRISRAQMMDVLSAMSTLAGYKSVLLAANTLGRVLPMLSTAAGTLPPAKALILGVGVAGLQAIATAKRLGAVVQAFDPRPACKEQVQSLGAEFIEVGLAAGEGEGTGGYAKELSAEAHRKTQEVLGQRVKEADIVITTALVPGKKAPVLITDAMLKAMKPGSVVVDLAAEQGGNCEGSEPGQEVVKHGVIILGPANLPSTMASPASRMYATNMANFLLHVYGSQETRRTTPDVTDEITRGTLITHQGQIVHEGVKQALRAGGGA